MSRVLVKQTGRWTALAAVVGLVAACEEQREETSVGIELYTAYGQDHLLQAGGPADIIEMVVIDLENPHASQRRRDLQIAKREGNLPSLDFGEHFCVFVRGFSASGDNAVPQFFGASTAFGVARGDEKTVSIQIGRADCLELNTSSRYNAHPEGADDLHGQRTGATMTELPDGRVLVIGGAVVDANGAEVQILDTIEIYEPNRGQFLALPARLDTPRAYHTATLLADGSVLVVGGISARSGDTVQVAGSASIINLADFEPVTRLPAPFSAGDERYRHQATPLSDGSVLITGGAGGDGTPRRSTFRYFPSTTGDPLDGQFRRQGDLWEPRAWHTTSPLPRSGELAVVAGGLGEAGPLDSIEVFTINPMQPGCVDDVAPSAEVGCFVRPMGRRMAEARWGHRAVPVEIGGNRHVLFIGGFASADRRDLASGLELIGEDLSQQSGDAVGRLGTARGDLTATKLHDGSILLTGGRRGDSPVAATSRLRLNGGQLPFVEAALPDGCESTEARFGHEAVRLQHGTVLVTGGVIRSAQGLQASRRVELYFPRVVDIESLYP